MLIVFSVVLKPKCESYFDSILYFNLIRHIAKLQKNIRYSECLGNIRIYAGRPNKKSGKKNEAGGEFFPTDTRNFWRFWCCLNSPLSSLFKRSGVRALSLSVRNAQPFPHLNPSSPPQRKIKLRDNSFITH